MPTISQLPLASTISGTDQLPISQGGVSRATTVGMLLDNLQPTLTLATNALLGRASPGPGGPESIALGTGLQIQNDVLMVDSTAFPQAGTLDTGSQLLINNSTGAAQLMPVSLLRGLYSAGENVSIDQNGTITYTPTAATGNSIGAVAVGEALVINASGQLSVNIGTVPGTVAAGNDPRIAGAEQTANKDQPNGYCGLDDTGLVPASLLPSFASSPVQSVNGQTGAVVLTAQNISGLGSVASQNANAVAFTGGSIGGVDASQMPATPALTGAQPRTLAIHFADYVNVNDFGLARNGTTDDSSRFVAACQAAIAAQKALYIPAGGPILLTDAAQQSLSNLCIFGDSIRDYDSAQGYGHAGSPLWFTGTTKTPFLLGPNVQFYGVNFFWPDQTEAATVGNGGQPIVYPPLFGMQSPAQNITYFTFIDCQVTNCYDFFTATSTSAVVGACAVDRCLIYAIHNCFTFTNNPEVFFISNTLFTWGVYGSVVSVGPTYNLRTYTNTQGTWMKVLGNGTISQISSTTVGGIMSSNNYVYGCYRGIWLAAGTMDISCFADTSFDTVPVVLQGDPGCALFSTRFTGGAWYPIYYTQALPDTTAVVINNPAPGGVGANVSFTGITVPFVNGSLVSISGTNISNLCFTDIRCNALGHTTGGTGPYYGIQINTPSANVRISGCDFQASDAALSNTAIQISACTEATISGCVIRNFSAPIDVETTSGTILLTGNMTQSTQGTNAITGVGTTNVHDLGNLWDVTPFAYNGFAPSNYRPGATIGITPVACSSSAGYVGVQPSATGSGGGTRFGVTALGSGVISLLTNAFNEEQVRINRQTSAANYISLHGSVTGGTAQITTGGGDANSPLQVTGLGTGATYLGSAGSSGSPVIRLGAAVDQSYVSSVPANGFSISVPPNCSTLLLRPASNLATGTVSLPAALADGEKIEIWTSRTITALTVNAAAGTVTDGNDFQLGANASVAFFWNASSATWYQSLGSGLSSGSIATQNSNAVAITGGSITGLSQCQVGNDAATSATLQIDAAAGYSRQVLYQSSSVPRWVAGAEGTPEDNLSVLTSQSVSLGATSLPLASVAGISTGMLVSAAGVAAGTSVVSISGSTGVVLSTATSAAIPAGESIFFYTNQGSDYAILPYDDTGAPLAPTLGQAFVITRATGQTTIKTLLVNGSAAVPTVTAGDTSTNAASTAFVANAIATRAVAVTSLGAPNGVATLDSSGHVPVAQIPASVQGALDYQGSWNAATNAPVLTSGTGTKGMFYTVSVAGSTALDGITQWNVGDHAAFNGVAWEKFDGVPSEVVSVAGRTGAVTLGTADIAGLGSMATQQSGAVAITGGTLDAVTLGGTTPAPATVTTLTAGSTVTLSQATLTVPSYAGLQVFGGSSYAGAARGLGAFDGQQYRTATTQVASGQYAVQFGTGNTTSAPGSVATGSSNAVGGVTGYNGAFGGSHSVSGGFSYALGNSHTLAGTYTYAMGFRARDFGRYGISLFASGDNTSNGDAQRGETVLRATTTGTAVRLTADGATAGSANTINLQANQVAKINIEITGYNSAGNAAACWFARDLLLGRATTVATTALSSSTLTAGGSIGAVAGWTAPTIAADTSNGGLAVTSGYAASTTIKWVARVVSLEVM
jgi:hypothetical protein